MYDYLEEYSESTGEEVELDIIALCCDYNEWEDLAEFNNDHSKEYENLEEIEEDTQVIRIGDNSDRFITQAF